MGYIYIHIYISLYSSRPSWHFWQRQSNESEVATNMEKRKMNHQNSRSSRIFLLKSCADERLCTLHGNRSYETKASRKQGAISNIYIYIQKKVTWVWSSIGRARARLQEHARHYRKELRHRHRAAKFRSRCLLTDCRDLSFSAVPCEDAWNPWLRVSGV